MDLTPKRKAAVDKEVSKALRSRTISGGGENNSAKVRIDIPVLYPKNLDVYLKKIKIWDTLTKKGIVQTRGQ